MASYVYICEAANIFVGDAGPNNDKSLILQSVKLPDLEENTVAFHPGGSYGALEIGGLGLKELMVEFKTVGCDPQTLANFGVFGVASTNYTIYGAFRSKQDNSLVQLKAMITGRMKKVTPDSYKRGDLFGETFQISEVIHYELDFNGAQLYFYDFFTQSWAVNGVSMTAAVNTMLGLAAT